MSHSVRRILRTLGAEGMKDSESRVWAVMGCRRRTMVGSTKSSLSARSEDEVIGGGFWGWRCSRSASGLHHSSGRVMVGEVMMLGCRGGGRSVRETMAAAVVA